MTLSMLPPDPRPLAFAKAIGDALPDREFRALRSYLALFFPYQLAWLLDWSPNALLVKSRRVGGSWTYAAQACLAALFGASVLRQVERHARVLATLGSRWALPARKKYVNDSILRLASGGVVTALPSTNAGRGEGGNVILDEVAYMQDAEAVWDAAAAASIHGRLRVLSTPNGTGGLFHSLVSDGAPGWTRHKLTLPEARAQGFKVDDSKIEAITRGSPELYSQLFMCAFLARGGAIFKGVFFCDGRPPAGYRVCIGIDLAYTAKTSSDWNAAVVLAEAGGVYYVLDVRRAQTTDFTPTLRQLQAAYPGARFHTYAMHAETGISTLLREQLGVPIHASTAGADKFNRALPVANEWSAGKVLVPRHASWLADFVAEVGNFNGISTKHTVHDDQVDALAAARDWLHATRPSTAHAPPLLHATAFGRRGAFDNSGARTLQSGFGQRST
jgi:predicted phage terminase large subunit-like protein